MNPMNKLIGLAICGIAIAFGTAVSLEVFAATADPVGQIARMRNDVRINEIASRRGDLFSDGAQVETGRESYSLLKFVDDSTIYLRENGTIRIEQFAHSAGAPETGNAVVDLAKGGMRVITGLVGKENPGAVRFTTPMGTIRIRGTDFVASLVGDNLYLTALDGSIFFTDPMGQTTFLDAGDTLVISSSGTIIASGGDAEHMADEVGAFTGLSGIDDLSDTGDSVHAWGPWVAVTDIEAEPVTTDLSSLTAAVGSSAGNVLDAEGIPVIEQDLDIPPPPIVGNGDDFVDVDGMAQ